MQESGFIGCLRDFKLWNMPQALDKNKNVVRSSQVEDVCPDTVSLHFRLINDQINHSHVKPI